ncbi:MULTISPECIES: alpha/beta fold hydrolase [unclassified Phyllobacterium]|uniref:alpha/beta fold hydrolase n=1 Tax=unclassified Phyllobacterium TaxID=2638441 RepID=UPI003012DD92
MTILKRKIETSHGTLALRETDGTGIPVLLIHGNSSSGAVFRNQLEGTLGSEYRLIAPDLPGHGESSDAINPDRSYSMEGYADAMTEVLRILQIERAVVFGWSLGGHIGLEMISRFPGMLGLMITGTPPVAADEVAQGFRPSEHMGLAGQEHFSEIDIENYARSTGGEPFEDFFIEVVSRTDGRARRLMFEKFAAGTGDNQKEIVANADIPIAVVNGVDEPFVNIDFVANVRYRKLWEGKTHTIKNSGHAPFWDKPDEFNPYLHRFIKDVSAR